MTQDGTASALAPDLAQENDRLRARMAYLVEQAELNHSIMTRHQAFDLEIVGASTFPELIGTIFRTLPAISDLEGVTLSLFDEDADIRTVMEKLGVDFAAFPDLIFVHDEAALGFAQLSQDRSVPPRPLLGPYIAARHAALFPAAAAAPDAALAAAPGAGAHGAAPLRSVALVPLLRNRRLIGSLNLASVAAERFTSQLGTDFIEHMASIIAICLENVISNEMLKYIGLTDSLTGVYNRRYIDRRLLEEIARARRQQYRIACLYIDIDHFKRVNDTHGHQGGDEVLRETAARIKQELRLSDALGRYGGEEFVVLLINASLASAAVVAERIRAGVAGLPILVPGDAQASVTVSIGVAGLADATPAIGIEAAARQLVAQADAALYQAKEGGRNRVVSQG